jgi:hypothetical protein
VAADRLKLLDALLERFIKKAYDWRPACVHRGGSSSAESTAVVGAGTSCERTLALGAKAPCSVS